METQRDELGNLTIHRRKLFEEISMVDDKIRMLQRGPQRNKDHCDEPDTSTEAGQRAAISRGLDIDAGMGQRASRPADKVPDPRCVPLNGDRKEELVNVAKGAVAMIGQQTNNANEAGFVIALVHLLM